MDDDFDGTEVRVNESTQNETKVKTGGGDKRKRKREKEKANKAANPISKKSKSSSDSEDGGVKLKPKPSKVVTDKGEENINDDIAKMAPSMLADYVGQRLKFWDKDLSSIELEDKYIPERVFQDTTAFTHPRILANLPSYLEKNCRVPGKVKFRLDRAAELPGAPHTLIISSAALRSHHAAGAVRKYHTKNSIVAKMFAKHIKLQESIEMCQKSRIGVAVGTPARILELLSGDHMKVSELRWIVVDASHVDKKSFGVFDIRETHKALMEILNHPKLKERYEAEGGTKILFF